MYFCRNFIRFFEVKKKFFYTELKGFPAEKRKEKPEAVRDMTKSTGS